MQDQWRQREIVDSVDLLGDLDLLLRVGVHLTNTSSPRSRHHRVISWMKAKVSGVMNEVSQGVFYGVADGIQPDTPGLRRLQSVQNASEVGERDRLPDIDVDLLGRKGGPDQPLGAVCQRVRGERQSGPRPVEPH
jgi:hypothetical protein